MEKQNIGKKIEVKKNVMEVDNFIHFKVKVVNCIDNINDFI